MSALELNDVAVPGRLMPVTLALAPGQLAGLVGPNGSGKSTLLQAAGGLLAHSGGVRWLGRPLARLPVGERGRLAAWVPQEAHFEFGFTVRSVVAQGRFAHGDDEQGVEAALERFALTALAHRPVNQLSGGERHRVLLARALATGAAIHLWDEPLAALDPRHALEVLKLAREITHAGATLLFSLHDLRLAHNLDVVAVMDAGRLRAVGAPEEVLTPELLIEVFGVRVRRESGLNLFLP
ncbi:MAG: ABC transporter ATP-binding protein [Opitutaceae bacterium]|nr:ABC transporter ATP-binding protein [Opitutaceae bacterium]